MKKKSSKKYWTTSYSKVSMSAHTGTCTTSSMAQTHPGKRRETRIYFTSRDPKDFFVSSVEPDISLLILGTCATRVFGGDLTGGKIS